MNSNFALTRFLSAVIPVAFVYSNFTAGRTLYPDLPVGFTFSRSSAEHLNRQRTVKRSLTMVSSSCLVRPALTALISSQGC